MGVSRQAVQKWESGASRPDMDNLAALGRYFDVTLDYLITGAEPAPAGDAAPAHPAFWPDWHYEYKSRATLFGLPLVHINIGRWGIRWARGIIAIGNVATGVLALGGLAAGGLAFGGAGLGLLSLGGLAIGGLALGGLAAGAVAAFGGLAFSFGLAVGGAAISGSYAFGGAAVAAKVAAGGTASAHIAIGGAVEGAVTFSTDAWGAGTGEAIRSAITQAFPNTPAFLTELFSRLC